MNLKIKVSPLQRALNTWCTIFLFVTLKIQETVTIVVVFKVWIIDEKKKQNSIFCKFYWSIVDSMTEELCHLNIFLKKSVFISFSVKSKNNLEN